LRDARFRGLIAANIISALVILVRVAGWLQPLELAIYDTLRVAWAGNQPSDRILLVGISESDQQNRWHFPLNDGELAELLDRLASWNPRAIGVDATWLPWGPTNIPITLIFRSISFTSGYSPVPSAYQPAAALCDETMFVTQGWQGCFSAAGVKLATAP
jgi:hypothetical protein